MAEARKFGNSKNRRKNAAKEREKYCCKLSPFPELTLEDMPEFKNRLYKAVTTNKVFMIYNGRKYSKGFAKFAIGVTENAKENRVIHDV